MFGLAESAAGHFDESLEAFRSQDVKSVGDAELMEGFSELHRAGAAIEAERLRWLAEVERRGLHRRDGHLSVKAWLADRFRMAAGAAKELVGMAQALEEMPEVRQSFSSGEVSSSAVRILAGARQAHPEAFAAEEPALLDAATTCSVPELRRVVDAWSRAADPEGELQRAERLRESRRLDMCPTECGMVRLHGELDPESGDAVMTAIGAICDAEVRSHGRTDFRTPAQLRADALSELAHSYLASPDRPSLGGERPHMIVTVDLETLMGCGRPGQRPPRASAGTGTAIAETGALVAARSSATPARSRSKPPSGSGAMLRCDDSCLTRSRSLWTWAGRPRSCRPVSAGQ
jgi:hypothetical protein